MIDFAAIDFAYNESNPMNPYKVCIVIVMNDHVVQEFQSYINLSDPLDENIPIEIKEKCKFAPPFALIEMIIGHMISNLPIVSFNSVVVKKLFEIEHEQIKIPIPYAIEHIINPCEIAGLSFEEFCKKSGIDVVEPTNLLDRVFDCAFFYTQIKGEDLHI